MTADHRVPLRLRAVTFDYWRTLIWEPPGELERVRLDHLSTVLTSAGHTVGRETLAAAHAYAFAHASAAWRVNRQYRAEHAAADIVRRLGITLREDVQHDLVRAFSDAGRQTPLKTAEGVKEALRGLRSAGIRLGIVCDVGLTPSPVLREHLERCDLLSLFDHWSFSDETGNYKPSVVPFINACRGLTVAPQETAHVGDQRRTDVVGAQAAGLTAVRYAGVFDDKDKTFPSGDLLVRHHDELLPTLGFR
jgi:putative hydrolase of the HAD superfamily